MDRPQKWRNFILQDTQRMTFVDSPVGPTQNPALAAFFGATAATTEVSLLDTVSPTGETGLDGTLDYGELFASLINAPQETGLFISQKVAPGAQAAQSTPEAATSVSAQVDLAKASTSPGAKDAVATSGAIDLSAFRTANAGGVEPLFGIQLTENGLLINEPGSGTFKQLQVPAQDSSLLLQGKNTPLQTDVGPLQSIIASETPELRLTGLPADQLGLSQTRSNDSHILPLKALATFMEGLPAEAKSAPVQSIQPNVDTSPVSGVPAVASDSPAAVASPSAADALPSVSSGEAISSAATVNGPETTQGLIKNIRSSTPPPETPISSEAVNPTGDVELDADGHIAAVQAANKKNVGGENQAANTSVTNQQSQAAAVQAAASQTVTTQPKSGPTPARVDTGERAAEKAPVVSAAKLEASDFAPARSAPVQAAFKPWSDTAWSGAWTPERLAGFGDGAGADMISGGLTGLKGDGGTFSAISIMGGKASAAMTNHVARQLNINVTKAVKAGEQEFAMRMDPPELGKVTVKLKFMADGIVKAHVMAERPETMDMLQREVRGLERAIEAGGSKTDDEGISFSLDSGNQESAGKAFAEALQQEKQQEQASANAEHSDFGEADPLVDDLTTELNLEEILAHMTPETGIDVRV